MVFLYFTITKFVFGVVRLSTLSTGLPLLGVPLSVWLGVPSNSGTDMFIFWYPLVLGVAMSEFKTIAVFISLSLVPTTTG